MDSGERRYPIRRPPGRGAVSYGFGLIYSVGHQWKLVLALMTAGSSVRIEHRRSRASESSSREAKGRLATVSSASGQRCSAGWSSGV